ncbi:MAG: GDP-mannose 4,6-dehydratase [Nanoarchaeota archaeon]|nr:GDP-mannose 4,6-dehydratase [Nanoarchaeota archaeon]MBU1704765.1 GDP-mannose 4,6-dehydratase [Nanoarchaeota archaeon]
MKTLVTGGAGFIGSQIVDILLKNHDVVILDNLSSGRYINEKAKLIKADIRDDLDKIFAEEKPEIVIHTAAQVQLRESLKDPINDAQHNILGTINVLEACRKNNVKKIIYTATGGARYGQPEKLPVKESDPIAPTSPYGISKHTAEHYVWLYDELYGLNSITFCFGNVYGPRDTPESGRVIPSFITRILAGKQPEVYGDGNQTRDFLYVKDLAEFIANSINKSPKHKLFNLANGEQVSVNQIISILSKISGSNIKPVHTKAIKGEVRDILLDTTLAIEELGWNPRCSIEQGLKDTYEWFKNE